MQPLPGPRRGQQAASKKHTIKTADPSSTTETLETVPTEEHFMFLQIIDVFPRYYLVKIDPVEDKIIYEDLLEFERNKITINILQFEAESLYMLYEGNVSYPERFAVWVNFCHERFTNPDTSNQFELNHACVSQIQKARWFVCVSLQWNYIKEMNSLSTDYFP